MTKKFTLGKNERIKSRKLISQLFEQGRNFQAHPFKIYYRLTTEKSSTTQGSVQFAISVPSKNFKKAVDRNRIKRLAREAYRLQKTALVEKATEEGISVYIFFVYIDKELPDFNVIKTKVGVALKKVLQFFQP
ncbi:MAG TPA: ribonuclease P protein component [Chitinophagaceae bacterium]